MNAAIDLGPPARRRRLVSLTPLIDVVFLLLVFFMLAARFSLESELPIGAAAGGGAGYDGPPRVIAIGPERLSVNGAPTDLAALPARIRALPPGPDAPIAAVLAEGTSTQRLVDVLDALRGAGAVDVVLIE